MEEQKLETPVDTPIGRIFMDAEHLTDYLENKADIDKQLLEIFGEGLKCEITNE